MLEPRNVADKKFNAETHKLIGKVQLQHYGLFFDKFHSRLSTVEDKLANNSNIRIEPILLDSSATEQSSVLNLVHSDNKLLSRILASLASICHEMNLLVEEAKGYFNLFVFYGEDVLNNPGNITKNIKAVCVLFEALQKVNCFLSRTQQVILLLLYQLDAILGKNLYISNTSSTFPEPLDCLGELLVCLITLDNLLSPPILTDHWNQYRRAVRTMLHNPAKFNHTQDELRALEKHLSEIQVRLLSGNIFRSTVDISLAENLSSQPILKKVSIWNEFTAYINQLLTELEKDEENISFTQIWLQVNALSVFQCALLGNPDKKTLKRLIELNKKASACTLVGNILWYPEEFLIKQLPIFTKLINEKSMNAIRLTQITTKSQNLPRTAHSLCSQASLCIISIERIARTNMSDFNVKHLQEGTTSLIEAIKLVKKISELVKWITNLHADKEQPMTKSVLLALCRLIEVLKCFQFTFSRNLMPLVYLSLLVTQQLTHKTLTLLQNIRKTLTQEKSYKQQQLDVLSALSVCDFSIRGPNTTQRILVAKLALSASGLTNENLSEIRSVINRLELICSLPLLLNKLCDCSFLYWHHSSLLPVYFSKLFETKADLSRYYLIISALNDCALIANDKVVKQTEDSLKKNLFMPMNQIVETNLRLQTHLHLHLPPSDPFNNHFPLNCNKFIPAVLKESYISIKNEAEHYLSTMFYNLTTVVLHDWQTYGEMRRLAWLQYGLETVEDKLPMQTIEQGLDVLEIMRNINVFVGKYLYNINNQVFIEEFSNNKHLNTINISHVANSIRTHGIGIMNTTVNFTYQFLQIKFFIFSQFMFDEHIKSRLLKDLRFFSEHKTSLNQMYPYERADKFNFDIRKLGLNPYGHSYLDLFRKLISHIGNAMGYVRLIRSGGRRCLADGTCFIPDFKQVQDLAELLKDETMPVLTAKAGNCLNHDLRNLIDNFEEATEYFKLLVNVFVPVFRNPKHIHLKNFYIIVPPLTINFVEHSLTCKERLTKKNKNDASFTDDGFAMGLAFIIELLEQENQLNSLHWFYSVKNKFQEDKKKIQKQRDNLNKEDDKLQQTLTLTEKRIHSFEREFELFYCSFKSARIFFQS